jgi:uncharacterized sulfatase
VYELRTHFRSVIPDVVTLPQLFQKNGYFAARVGKIYHYGVPGDIGTSGLDDPPSWNYFHNPKGVDKTKEEPLLTNYTPNRGLGSAVCYHASDASDEEHTDGILANEVIRLLEEKKNEPFFLGAGFYRPHVPWIAPKKYFDRFKLSDIPLHPMDEAELTMAPEYAYFTRPAHWGMNETQRKEAMRAYYASIEFMDAQVGRVLNALDRLKLTANTTIVFWGDNGYQLGEHGQWMKQTVFEPSARVPFLIGGAGVKARGKACGRTVEMLDFYPTLAAVCGLQGVRGDLHGRSLAPLLNNPQARWDKPAISQVRRGSAPNWIHGHSLRTERYRYSFWDFGAKGEELYDYQANPRENRNLASDPALAGVKDDLKKRLTEILRGRGAKV